MPLLVLVMLLLFHHIEGHAREQSRDDCSKIQQKIDHYTELRRGGGSVAQMESWKRKRQEYKDRFRRGNCKRYGRVNPSATSSGSSRGRPEWAAWPNRGH